MMYSAKKSTLSNKRPTYMLGIWGSPQLLGSHEAKGGESSVSGEATIKF